LQFKRWIHHQRRRTQCDHKEKIEKKKESERIQGFWIEQEEEEGITSLLLNPNQESTEPDRKFQVLEGSSSNLQLKLR